ncbi:MAG: zinc ribbon domain-containing protein [Clostridiales bacterium]|nr:zinc ribbon domain-containing protein [Clostridiales bacterium]
MAILNCPECGEKISSTAKQCVHCGCKITVCSECGKVILGERGTCPDCGFKIDNEKKNDTTNKYGDLSEIVNEWKAENNLLAFVLNNLTFLALWGVSILLFIISIIYLISWKSGPATNLLNIKDVLNTTKTLCIISAIVYALSSMLYIFDFQTYTFRSWAKRKNIDLKYYLEKALQTDTKNLSGESALIFNSNILLAEKSLRFSNDLQSKMNEQKFSKIKFLLSTILTFFICFFIVNNIESYLEKVFITWSVKFKLSDIVDFWMVIVALILYAIKYIVNKIYEKKENELQYKWIKNNLTEYYENFKTTEHAVADYFSSSKYADKKHNNIK